MADMKPYNPNKSWIEFRLDPDMFVDELGNLIPYRNTIGMIDSEAPWPEVGRTAVRETPILGSLLAGEPLDAAKEAVLLMSPTGKKSNKLKLKEKDINKKIDKYINDQINEELANPTNNYYEVTLGNGQKLNITVPKGGNITDYLQTTEPYTYRPLSNAEISRDLRYHDYEDYDRLRKRTPIPSDLYINELRNVLSEEEFNKYAPTIKVRTRPGQYRSNLYYDELNDIAKSKVKDFLEYRLGEYKDKPLPDDIKKDLNKYRRIVIDYNLEDLAGPKQSDKQHINLLDKKLQMLKKQFDIDKDFK